MRSRLLPSSVGGEPLEVKVEQWRRLLGLHVPATAVADNLPVDLAGVFLAGGPEAQVALPVQPRLPIAGVEFHYGLQPGVAAIDAALDEGHRGYSHPVAANVIPVGLYPGLPRSRRNGCDRQVSSIRTPAHSII